MKHYTESKAYKIRLFLNAFKTNPAASVTELADLAHLARNTAVAHRDHMIDHEFAPSELLKLTDKELCEVMARNRRSSKLHPFDAVEMQLLRKKGFNKKQCYRRYLSSIPTGGIAMTLRTFRDRLQKTEHKDPSMKLVFVAGDVMMADYAGFTPEAISPFGLAHKYSIFVATLPCSQRIFADVHEYQRIEDWIDGLTAAIHEFGGIARRIIPDNPRALVIAARRGKKSALLHPAFQHLCDHYQCKGDPARPGKPTDKSLVETAVNLIQMELVPELTLRSNIHLEDLKVLLMQIVDQINHQPMDKRQKRSRMDWFNATDAGALKPITMNRHQYIALDSVQRVTRQYRVLLDGSTYSVPHSHIGKEAYCRATRTSVEVFVDGKVVAQHPRARREGLDLLIDSHMPQNQAAYHYEQDGHMLAWGEGLDDAVRAIVAFNLDQPAPGNAKAQRMKGLQKLQLDFGTERFIRACKLALSKGRPDYRTLRNMLNNGRDYIVAEMTPIETASPVAANVRGSTYYAGRLG